MGGSYEKEPFGEEAGPGEERCEVLHWDDRLRIGAAVVRALIWL